MRATGPPSPSSSTPPVRAGQAVGRCMRFGRGWQDVESSHVCKCRASSICCAANSAPAAGLTRGTHQQQLQRFVKEIAQLDDVYFVTMRQLLAWMQVRAARRPCASFRWPSPCWACASPRPTVAVNAHRVPVRFALHS